MIRQYELVERVKAYHPDADEDLINRAYVYSMRAHGAQRRASGDPYFLHPLEVAGILADMRLDTESIVTGLLHDTVEDTVATLDDIESRFGTAVRDLVDGVTKLSQLELQDSHAKQAENFRKLVVAMSRDIRVLLVKLADRLHNMRTLDAIASVEKRQRIATETLEIYAPLAERIGMGEMKDELEDLAFLHLNPEARQSIVNRLEFLREEGGGMVDRVIADMAKVLKDGGVNAQITGREKRPYSIWRKMQRKQVAFEQLSDIMAFRIQVDSVGDCYNALGLIHANYKSLPNRFKDFISTPKTNGYSSLHTGVLGPQKQRIEVQIRTSDMHDVAELGVAAHWSYKSGEPATDGPQYRWLRELLDIMEHAARPEEFLEHTKLELFQDQVFCFTPKGMLVNLPQGATPIDFAYAVHSEVGDRTVGAKVNGRLVPLRETLQTGDQVEILTSKTSTPSPEWERIAVTGKARARIRRFVRQRQREQYAELGRAILVKSFRGEGHALSDKAVDAIAEQVNAKSSEEVYANVGSGILPARDVFNAVFPEHRTAQQIQQSDQRNRTVIPLTRGPAKKSGDRAIPIKGLIPGMAVHFARCCHPIPGDRIVGIVTTGKGVTIHTIDCETLESFYDQPERWIDVSWDENVQEDRTARIRTVIANEPGSLGNLTTVIGKSGGNITNLKIVSRTQDFFEMLIDINVHDAKHLATIIAALRATKDITTVDRAQSA